MPDQWSERFGLLIGVALLFLVVVPGWRLRSRTQPLAGPASTLVLRPDERALARLPGIGPALAARIAMVMRAGADPCRDPQLRRPLARAGACR